MINSVEGNIIDIHNESIYPARIIIKDGIIVELRKNNKLYTNYLIPGLVDAHVHIESSLLAPSRFAKIAVTHGTIAVVSDPHEIANVCGLNGIKFMMEDGNTVPFYFSFGAPSSVPATIYESNGSTIGYEEINSLFSNYKINYLSEVMNYPGVINGDKEIIDKINLATKLGKKIDGHAPELIGENLSKYASYGIDTDHECSSLNEAIEKINKGFKILIREGSAARNFDSLAPLIDLYPSKVMLCTDDFHPDNLIKSHINQLIKRGLDRGLHLFNLLKAASINPAIHYKLPIGLLRINDPADFVVIDTISSFNILQTWIRGKAVFSDGRVKFKTKRIKAINNFEVEPLNNDQLIVKAKGKKIKVINLNEGELITSQSIEYANIINDIVFPDLTTDILKLVVVNRYQKHSIPAIGFVKNFGLKVGAIAASISHDSHNIIAVGTNDQDLIKAINVLIKNKGGMVVCHGKKHSLLKLKIAGLMSDKHASIVQRQLIELNDLVKEYGCILKAPFMALSFLSLIVIPHLKLSDQGLFDVDSFSFTELFAS
jgi:adenine deaminase